MNKDLNYFDSKTAAERYAKGRPNVQKAAIAAFKVFANVTTLFKKCLDVGCGTGMSSVAVAEICESVIGVDMSDGMLSQAANHPKIKYERASAENLPFEENSFDLITAGLAMHWFDQLVFLKEAKRVLMPNGWLVIYNNEFKHELLELAEFREWFNDCYLKLYPNPPRKNALQFDEKLATDNFEFLGKGEFSNDIKMTHEQFVSYLTTQSNIIAKVEQGNERIEHVEHWLLTSTEPYFEKNKSKTVLFTGEIWYLRKEEKKRRTLPLR